MERVIAKVVGGLAPRSERARPGERAAHRFATPSPRTRLLLICAQPSPRAPAVDSRAAVVPRACCRFSRGLKRRRRPRGVRAAHCLCVAVAVAVTAVYSCMVSLRVPLVSRSPSGLVRLLVRRPRAATAGAPHHERLGWNDDATTMTVMTAMTATPTRQHRAQRATHAESRYNYNPERVLAPYSGRPAYDMRFPQADRGLEERHRRTAAVSPINHKPPSPSASAPSLLHARGGAPSSPTASSASQILAGLRAHSELFQDLA